jgi:hypothetical protein
MIEELILGHLQIGVATVTCIAICGAGLTVLLMFGMKPESKPPVSRSQGVVKADCVAVWLFDMNVKITMSPTAASMVSGVYTNPAEPPTTTF